MTTPHEYIAKQPKALYFEDTHSLPCLQKLRTNSVWFYHVYSSQTTNILTLYNPFYCHFAMTVSTRHIHLLQTEEIGKHLCKIYLSITATV